MIEKSGWTNVSEDENLAETIRYEAGFVGSAYFQRKINNQGLRLLVFIFKASF